MLLNSALIIYISLLLFQDEKKEKQKKDKKYDNVIDKGWHMK